ncbi:PI-PLC X domain-containing protein 3 [Trichinella pseudospiralis]|uniref:DDRGK domain-containing protein 1 n=3 Tax=Trichinella pseudospiralis TaxID=6337 RepID=A0A0V1K6C3_TRIPS|nr:PI-PLC X domain-containing protein 3 [Trichinella pseudospiralis]KRZ42769.1 PI-PLC X domain-containing protein 3 [Trichinella pseudospiralis]
MNQSDMTQHNENWMRDLPLFLKMKPLTHLFIPGSHQSFSDLLNKKLPIAIDVPKVLRFVDSPWTRRTIERWGRCQELNVTDQLRLGIRYFDVRVAFLPGECEQSLDIFLLHGLYGRPIKEVLNEMYTFIIDHPEEILILDINHFYNFNDELHRKFLGQLEHLFNGKFIPAPPSLSLNQVTVDYAQQHGFQLLLFYQQKLAEQFSFIWPSSYIASPWANTNNVQHLWQYTEHILINRDQILPNGGFFVTQCILTPTWWNIVRHFKKSLRTVMAAKTTEQAVSWLKKNNVLLMPFLNIVIVDFVQLFDFYKLITMDPMLICSVLILLVFMAIGCIQIYKLFLKENRNIRRVNLNELAAQRNNNRQQQQAARALVGGRHAGGVRRRNVAAAGDASGSDSGGEESEIKLPGKVGKKKLAKLRAKEERKQAREAEEEERAIKRQLEEERAEKRRKREEEEEEKERQKELEEKRRLEEEKRKEQEEYEKLKKGFTVEEQGCDVDISEDTTNLLKEFVEYIQKVKVVSMEELAGQFHMRTTDVIDRLKNLLADGMLTGVIDDRGKFIFVTEDEMKAIVTFVKQRGRVSVDDLVDYSNKLINMDPQHVTLQCS